MKKSLSVTLLSIIAAQNLAQQAPILQSGDITNWIRYTVVADRVRQELEYGRHQYAYMDRPYTEYSGMHSRFVKGDKCIVDKRVYPLIDRTIVQYVDHCNGRVIEETSHLK